MLYYIIFKNILIFFDWTGCTSSETECTSSETECTSSETECTSFG